MRFLHLPAVLILCHVVAGCSTTPDVVDTPLDPVITESANAAGSNVVAEPVNPDEYILGQGDTISIQVFDEPDLTLNTSVGNSGSINYSYLGDVQVAGKSPLQLERHIAQLLQNGYLVNPSVNVAVIEYRPFYINGEVRAPGSYPYQPGLTLDKAIALAGGMTDRASARKMFVNKGGDDSQNSTQVFLNSRIAPGDIITIKEGFF